MSDPFHEEHDTPSSPSQPHYLQWGLTAFCVIVASGLIIYLVGCLPRVWSLFKKLLHILSPFIYGFVMAYLLTPIFNMLYRTIEPYLTQHMKHGARFAKGLCSILTLSLGLAVVCALLYMVLPQLVVSIFSLLESMDSYLEEISSWVAALLKDNPVMERNFLQIYQQLSKQMINWVENIALPQLVSMMTGVVSTVSVLFDLFIGIIIALYILNSKDIFCAQAKKILYSLFSIKQANNIMRRVAQIHRVFGGFITGKLLDSLIMGFLCFCGLQLLMQSGLLTVEPAYALLISVIVGVTNIIPFFGPFIGAVPSAILIMVTSPLEAIYFVIFVLILQQIDGNIIGPKILGNSTGLSSFWVMFAILLFGGIFGFVGMAIGVPLFAVLYSVLKEKFNYLLELRGLSTNTNDYRGKKRIDPESQQFIDAPDEVLPTTVKEHHHAHENIKKILQELKKQQIKK